MAYDVAHARTVLYGGMTNGVPVGHTWLWDGASWTQANPPTSPPPRISTAPASDAARRRAVMLGGADTTGNEIGDTWEWDGTTWAQMTTGTAPDARYMHGAAFDGIAARSVVLGGVRVDTPANEAPVWGGSAPALDHHVQRDRELRRRQRASGYVGVARQRVAIHPDEWDHASCARRGFPDADRRWIARAVVGCGRVSHDAERFVVARVGERRDEGVVHRARRSRRRRPRGLRGSGLLDGVQPDVLAGRRVRCGGPALRRRDVRCRRDLPDVPAGLRRLRGRVR